MAGLGKPLKATSHPKRKRGQLPNINPLSVERVDFPAQFCEVRTVNAGLGGDQETIMHVRLTEVAIIETSPSDDCQRFWLGLRGWQQRERITEASYLALKKGLGVQ